MLWATVSRHISSFHKKRWNDDFLIGAVPGSDGEMSKNGWSTSSIFQNYISHSADVQQVCHGVCRGLKTWMHWTDLCGAGSEGRWCYRTRCFLQSDIWQAMCSCSSRIARRPILHMPQSSICARLHLNSYHLTYGRLTALTLTPWIIKFGAVFRNEGTRSPYVTWISWNNVWSRCGLTCSRQSSMRPLVNGGRDSGHASVPRDIVLNICFNFFALSVVC